MIAEYGIGDVVGGEGEARNLHQQRVIGQCGRVGQLRFDHLALLQIVAGDDEIGGWHCFDPCTSSRATIFAPTDDRFATAMMFKMLFDLDAGIRHCEERSDEAIHLSPRGGMDCFASLAMTRRVRKEPAHAIARSLPSVCRSRSLRLKIFPVASRGMASMDWMS